MEKVSSCQQLLYHVIELITGTFPMQEDTGYPSMRQNSYLMRITYGMYAFQGMLAVSRLVEWDDCSVLPDIRGVLTS